MHHPRKQSHHKHKLTNHEKMSTPRTVSMSKINRTDSVIEAEAVVPTINPEADRFPYCIVWTPIPVLTWLLPIVGHMGICMSDGVIRDFAGPYFVSEDNMAFGKPTRYLKLSPNNVQGGSNVWNEGVSKASVLYGTRMHNLFCDNCHSHVATALSGMKYRGKTNWNMITLASWMFLCGRYVSFRSFVKTWLPSTAIVIAVVLLVIYI